MRLVPLRKGDIVGRGFRPRLSGVQGTEGHSRILCSWCFVVLFVTEVIGVDFLKFVGCDFGHTDFIIYHQLGKLLAVD